MTKNIINKSFLGISLMVLFDAFIPQIITIGGRVLMDHYRMVMNIICLIIFLISSILIAFNFHKVRKILSGPYMHIGILFIWIYLSHFWSNNIYATFEGSILLTFTLIFSVYAFVFLKKDEFWEVLYDISLIITIASIVLILLLPEIALMPEGYHQGDWRGVFLHKNALGNYMAIINIIFLVSIRKRFRSYISLIGYFLSWILIIGSGSKTSLASSIFIHISIFFLLLIKSKNFSFKLILSLASIPIILIAIFIILNYEKIAFLLGGSTTLTGRIPLWYNVILAISKAPVLGYGYAAFWGSDLGSIKFMINTDWLSGKSHNAFLDVWLDLGIIGLILFIVLIVNTLIRLLKLYRNTNDKYGEAYLLILIMIISVSMIDFRILYYNSIVFFLVVYIYFYSINLTRHEKFGWKLVRVKEF
jgi:O-antigen ligase